MVNARGQITNQKEKCAYGLTNGRTDDQGDRELAELDGRHRRTLTKEQLAIDFRRACPNSGTKAAVPTRKSQVRCSAEAVC